MRAGAVVAEGRIAAHRHGGIGPLVLAEEIGDGAFRELEVDGDGLHLLAGPEPRRHGVEHHLHDVGHAGQRDHIANHEPRRDGNGVRDQLCVVGYPGHAQAAGCQLHAALFIVGLQQCQRPRVDADPDPECLGDRIGGDVVVRRADAAGREHIIIARPQGVDGGDDIVRIISDDTHLPHLNADRRAMLGDVADVLVLRAPRQDLVADDENRSRDDVVILSQCHPHDPQAEPLGRELTPDRLARPLPQP